MAEWTPLIRREPTRSTLPRILVVTPIYPWAGNPIEGVFIKRQIQNLVRLGHECRVLVYHGAIPGLPRCATSLSWLRYHPRWMTWKDGGDIPTAHCFYPRSRSTDVVPEIVDRLARYIECNPEFQQTDVIYSHWLWTGGAAGLGLRSRFGWPVASIARGGDLHRWQRIHPHCRKHVHHVIANVDLLLANCASLAFRISEIDDTAAHRVKVIYNGCDAAVFHPAQEREFVRARLGFRSDRKYMLACATIAAHKGITELAEAWQEFHRSHTDWQLVVLGGIAERQQGRVLRRSGRRSITLLGAVIPEEVRSYMQAADAYVQPSREEGLANATLEAMATGLPVISTDAGGQGEALLDREVGWLVPRCDAKALLEAMTALAESMPDARQRGACARRSIERHFDPIIHASLLSAHLCTLAAHGVTGPTSVMRTARRGSRLPVGEPVGALA